MEESRTPQTLSLWVLNYKKEKRKACQIGALIIFSPLFVNNICAPIFSKPEGTYLYEKAL